MDRTQEKDLVRLATAGDVGAFESLILPHQKKVYNIALNFSRNHDDALEISQDALLKAFRAIKSFKGDSSFSTWLFRITTNLCIDTYRKNNNVTLIYIDKEMDQDDEKPIYKELPSKFLEPSEACLQKEIRAIILDALNQLPLELKSIVVLRDIHGFSYDEIAQILTLPLGTVKSRINRARQILKGLLLSSRELFDKFTV